MISSQDINCVFKDTKLSVYEGSQQALEAQGHPLTIQYELTTYLFDDEAYKDMVILRYKIINMSTDSLRDCWFGMVSDNESFFIENEDIRVLMATGPFHLNPNDTAICAFMLNFANTVSGGEADGSNPDVANLLTSVNNGRDLYYNKHLITKIEDGNQTNQNLSINKLYPNPADNYLNIEFNIPNDGSAVIDILDLIGNRIGSFTVLCQSRANSFSINTMNFQSGTYFLKINNLRDASQSVCTKVFSILK